MLSTKQKKLRDISKGADSNLEGFQVRKLHSQYDRDRVAELWANLSMIQQMRGISHWMDEATESKLKWNEFIDKLTRRRSSRVIVFENKEEIFGFSYMLIEPLNANNPKCKTQTKAVIKELYLEPAYRKQSRDIELAEMMRDCIGGMGIDFVEFDVKDLDI